MHKRGQIYILAAIILAFIIFGLVSVVNKAEQESLKSDFEKLSDNYEKESAKLVNSLLIEGQEKPTPAEMEAYVSQSFRDFTVKFTSYAKAKNPKFGLVYAFNYGNKLYIGNYLDKEINNIKCKNEEGATACSDSEGIKGCYDTIPASIQLGGLELEMDMDQSLISGLEECQKPIPLIGGMTPRELKLVIQDTDTLEEYEYGFELLPNQPQVMLMSQEEKGAQRKIYVHRENKGDNQQY